MRFSKKIFAGTALLLLSLSASAEQKQLWQIGKIDGSSAEFDGAKESFKGYVHRLGDRDKLFLVGVDDPAKKWTWILPGPNGGWAGHGYWSWRVNFASLAFTLNRKPEQASTLVIDFAQIQKRNIPTIRIEINGHLHDFDLKTLGKQTQLRLPIPQNQLRLGSNIIRMHSRFGGWVKFDALSLLTEDENVKLAKPRTLAVQDLFIANKEQLTTSGTRQQALVIDVINRLDTATKLDILVDEKKLDTHAFPRGRQSWEVMLPAVKNNKIRKVTVRDALGSLAEKKITQKPAPLETLSDEVNLLAGTCNSRWMFTPGPAMPMSMMRISPENEPTRWKAGYDYQVESISGFSHIHEWTMSGLLTMPHLGKMQWRAGDRHHPERGWRSRFDKKTEKVQIGHYSVLLKDTGIKAEISSTERAAISKFTYPNNNDPRLICALQTNVDEYGTFINEAQVELVGDREIRGYSVQQNKGSGYPEKQDYTVHFVMQFDHPIKEMGLWADGKPLKSGRKLVYKRKKGRGDCGFAPVFDLPKKGAVVQVRTAISLVDIDGAANNLKVELADKFGWNFQKVVENQRNIWNNLLGRFEIKTHDRTRRKRFYTCLYRTLAGRGAIGDVDGRWRDAYERIQTAPKGVSMSSSDALWGTHWNLNQIWNWFYPEVSANWMQSQLAYFDAIGWTLKGPAGGEAIGVMLGSPEIPLMAGAWTAGVRPVAAEKLWKAVYHQQTTPGENLKCGGFAGNEHYADYLKYGYIPKEGRGYAHYSSSTFEYAYQDWCTGQIAKMIKRPKQDIALFEKRANNWRNALNPTTKLAAFRKKDGSWTNNAHCAEGSASQFRWHVPHNVNGLFEAIGRNEAFNVLKSEFINSEKMNYMAPADNMNAIKINHGNQPMMHVSWLFNAIGKPEESQHWVRSILDRYYGYTPFDAYLGDEDQGQMSGWLNLASIGIFSIDGGVGPDSMVELIPPSFEKITIHRPNGANWIIKATTKIANTGEAKTVTINGKTIAQKRIQLKTLLHSKGPVTINWK